VVAHWWTPFTWQPVDWRELVRFGVDGFEVTWAGERAPRELIDAWNDAGLLLLAASDFHGYRRTLYSWNLIDRSTVNPDGLPLRDLDPWRVLDRIFRDRDIRVVAANTYSDAVPAWIEPPFGVWRYAASLPGPSRAVCALAVFAAWLVGELLSRRRAPQLPEEAELADEPDSQPELAKTA
jgi:hypothetical protein